MTEIDYSINMLVDATNGNVVADLAYDAWGRPRNPNDWTYNNITLTDITDRGYTGHEMLSAFGLINMNGRCYDPFTGQFLSPDPFVQNATDAQSYNRYSYCLNNPLKYIDPSGYFNIWMLNSTSPWPSNTLPTGGADQLGFYGWFIRQNLWSAGTWFDSRSSFSTEFSREQAGAYNRLRTYTGWREKDEILNYQGGGLFGKGGYYSNLPLFNQASKVRIYSVDNRGFFTVEGWTDGEGYDLLYSKASWHSKGRSDYILIDRGLISQTLGSRDEHIYHDPWNSGNEYLVYTDHYVMCGDEKAQTLFEFLSRVSTKAEWDLTRVGDLDGKYGINILTTSHIDWTVFTHFVDDYLIDDGINYRGGDHSHPSNNPNASDGDMNHAKRISNTYPGAIFRIYTPGRNEYFKYNRYGNY